MEKILLLDGNNLLHRAFYALPPMTNDKGAHTNAVYGFMGMLIRLIGDYRPEYLAVAFDLHGPTFRHEKYAEYKAGRKATPEELRPQFPLLRELMDTIGVASLTAQGFEADDLLGAMSREAAERGVFSYLVTGDRDAFQLIGEDVSVLYTHRGVTDVDVLTPETLKEKYGYSPERVTDMKALMGDTSDNIPGIPGIGPKTALKLVEHFGSLEEILARPEEVLKGAMLTKVREGGESARLSKDLATIRLDAPVSDDWDAMRTPSLRTSAVYDALHELGMKSLVARIKKDVGGDADDVAPSDPAETFAKRKARPETVLLRDSDSAREWLKTLSYPAALTTFPYIEVADAQKQARLCARENLLDEGMEPDQAYAFLAELKEPLYFHDAKTVRAELRRQNVAPPPIAGDSMIMAYLLYQKSAMPLKDVVNGLYGEAAGEGAGDLFDACLELEERLRAEEMDALYRDVELPLIDVLADMETRGFTIDTEALRALGERYDADAERVQKEIYALAGEEFNIHSPKQIGHILFEKMGLPPGKKTKSGYSTDADVLENLEHPIAEKIMEYRTLTKLKSTYVDGLLAAADSYGRVHTTLHQTGTSTGRISSAEPNLQNIPVRAEIGRPIRDVFTSEGAGRVLIDADYSQIELRVLAHASGDENMREAFRLGQDIHTRTASEIFGAPMDAVTPSMRSSAKAVNFGVVYGISGFGLARNTGISQAEAREFIAAYFARYPGVRKFMDDCVKSAHEKGYVSTLLGRRRFIPELNSSNRRLRSFGERAAMNAPIQGAAADIIKLAMVRVSHALVAQGFSARLILQVHDELILEAPEHEADAVKQLLIREMENVVSLSVPLVADAGIGKTWGGAK